MIRKSLIVAALVLSWTILGSASPAKEPAAPKKTPFVHVVIFHLKKDAPKGEVDKLIADSRKMLSSISSVRSLWAGRPAEMATPIAKKFDAALLVLFDDAAGLQTYLKDPQHLAFVKEHTPYIDAEKLSVFDFMDRKGK